MAKKDSTKVDDETQEIIDEMKDEGIENEYTKDKEESSDTEEEKTEGDDDQEDDSSEDEESEDDSADDESDESEDSEDEEDEDEPDEGSDTARNAARERRVPTWSMVKKLNKEVSDLRAELAKRSGGDDLSDKLQDLAKRTNSDPEALKELVSILREGAGLSAEDRRMLQEAKQFQLDTAEERAHKQEMQRVSKHFPELRGNKKAQQKLSQLAYTEANKNTPLVEIYLENKDKIIGKGDGTRSSEPSRGGSQRVKPVKDTKKVFEEGNIDDLSDEEFDKEYESRLSGKKFRQFTPAPKGKVRIGRK